MKGYHIPERYLPVKQHNKNSVLDMPFFMPFGIKNVMRYCPTLNQGARAHKHYSRRAVTTRDAI